MTNAKLNEMAEELLKAVRQCKRGQLIVVISHDESPHMLALIRANKSLVGQAIVSLMTAGDLTLGDVAMFQDMAKEVSEEQRKHIAEQRSGKAERRTWDEADAELNGTDTVLEADTILEKE